MVELFANSGDPDQTPRSAASDLGLHCLPVTRLGVTSCQRVKKCFFYLLKKRIYLSEGTLDVEKQTGKQKFITLVKWWKSFQVYPVLVKKHKLSIQSVA